MSELRYSDYLRLVETLELPDGDDPEIPLVKARLAEVLNALGITPTPGTLDHGDLAGLLDDDHLQYILGDRSQYALLLANLQNVPVGADGLITGGQVVWTGLLTFSVSPSTYRIGGVDYSSVLTALTLGTADGTNPRIDVIAVNSSGAAVVIAGTPAASPAAPAVDPTTQIALTFIFVAALATVPTGITNTSIYAENTEWTSSQTGSHHTLASTNNPHGGTKDIEATAAVATDAVSLVKPAAGTELLSNYNNLIFYLRFKAVWPNVKQLTVAFFNGATQIGNAVIVKGGLFNLDAANITAYQQVVIPVANFNAVTAVTTLKITVVGGGAAIGYYLDDISLQGGVVTNNIPSNIMIHKGVYNAAVSYAINDVVTSTAGTFVALAASVGVTPGTNSAIWKALTAFDTTAPANIGTAAAGTQVIAAHRDHVHSMIDAIEFVIDGGGDVIETGVKGYLEIPFACTITRVTTLLDVSGSIVIDIWKDTYANYPPVDADSITASAPPTISSALKAQDSTLTGWTTAIAAGDVLGFNVDSIATATKATISLRVNRA